MSFENLNLSQPILKALLQSGYTKPTPIQEQAIPRVLAGKDLIAIAQTGTGKTAAFVLPALQFLSEAPKQKLPSVLILVPVRELANQVTDAIHKYSSQAKVKVVSILGGMPYHTQLRHLSQPVDIIVATPGRLIDYLKRGNIDLSQIKMLILDEADRMLDMGFIDDVRLIAKHISNKHQTLLFTATMDDQITKLAQSILNAPEHISVKGKAVTLDQIKQSVYITDDVHHKNQILEHILNSENIFKGIIFSATKHHADKLSRQLRDQGHHTDVLHGDIRQRKRNMILDQFRNGKIKLLVATDVAARGIDVSDVTHIINYDIPRGAEDYVHRIGRTGRAGKSGIAISFVAYNENRQLKNIERFINASIAQQSINGMEPKRSLTNSDQKSKKSWGGKGRSNGRGRSSGGYSRRSGDGDSRSSDSNNRRSNYSSRPRSADGESRSYDSNRRSNFSNSRRDGDNRSSDSNSRSNYSRPRSADGESRNNDSNRSNYSNSRRDGDNRSNDSNSRSNYSRPRSADGESRNNDSNRRSNYSSSRRDGDNRSNDGNGRSNYSRPRSADGENRNNDSNRRTNYSSSRRDGDNRSNDSSRSNYSRPRSADGESRNNDSNRRTNYSSSRRDGDNRSNYSRPRSAEGEGQNNDRPTSDAKKNNSGVNISYKKPDGEKKSFAGKRFSNSKRRAE